MKSRDLPQIDVLRKSKINLPVEAVRETVSLLPIEAGDVLFRMTNRSTYARHLITGMSGREAKGENLPAFSQLEMYNYIKSCESGTKIFPDESKGFLAFATIATANSTGDGALADALQVFYGPTGKHKVFVSKTLKPNGKTAYDSDANNTAGRNVMHMEPIVVEDLAYKPNQSHETSLFNNYESIASKTLESTSGEKIDYFCGYGCITIPQTLDHKHKLWTYREEWQTRMALVNLLIGSRILKKGANLCNKVQDAHSRVSMDLAYIHSLFFERVYFYEPPCMGWIGRRYIIGLGFKGYASPNDEIETLRWLDQLKDAYEDPRGVPLTILPQGTVPSDFQKDWETAMGICDQQIVDDFTCMFGFLVDHKDLWKNPKKKNIQDLFEKQWKETLLSVWDDVASDPEWKTKHLKVISRDEVERLKMPAHYVQDVLNHADLLYAMSQNEVVLSWV